MNTQQYISKAKEIILKHDLQKYVDVLIDYWTENPTTLGHGFEHVLKAAVECYLFAAENGYASPEELFVAGLYHDVFRPAEGKDASEDHHEESAEVIKTLFTENNLSTEIKDKLINYLMTQDEWRGKSDTIENEFDLYLFLGERATHTSLMADAYAWASNQFAIQHGGKPIYDSHLRTAYGLVRYQVPVWKIFMNYLHLKGIERGIEAYIGMYNNATNMYFQDKTAEHFDEYLQGQADKVRLLEQEYLAEFVDDPGRIEQLMSLMK